MSPNLYPLTHTHTSPGLSKIFWFAQGPPAIFLIVLIGSGYISHLSLTDLQVLYQVDNVVMHRIQDTSTHER